jgi:hypothetical protein
VNQRLKYIVASRVDGLGGRLLNLASTFRVAKKLGLEHLVCWNYPSVPQKAIYSKLFEGLSFIKLDYFDNKGLKVYNLTRKHNQKIGRKEFTVTNNIIENFDVVVTDHLGLLGLEADRGRITTKVLGQNKGFRRELREAINRVKPNSYIRKEVQDFLKKNDLKKCVGVHVRRGDVERNVKRGVDLHKFRQVQQFFDCLDEIRPERIFLCTEGETVRREFIEKYGAENVLFYPARSYIRECPITRLEGSDEEVEESLNDAFIDNLLLSECSKILHVYSNFTEAAALRGGQDLIKVD